MARNRTIATKTGRIQVQQSGPNKCYQHLPGLTETPSTSRRTAMSKHTQNLCRVCGIQIPWPTAKGGQPRRYCSESCRNAHRRSRYIPKTPKPPTPLRERLYSRVKETEKGCLEWQGHRMPFGYGQIMLDDGTHRVTTTHRAAWMLEHGPIPEGLVVRHKCDNPPCVNVAHLELGTHQDNAQDAVDRGRHPRGSDTYNAVLTDEDVRHIRATYRVFTIPGLRGKHSNKPELAAQFGVSESYIKEIVGRRERTHVA